MGKRRGHQGELQRCRHALGDQLGHRAAMAVGDAEVALRRVGEEAAVLHEEGIVEAESLAQFGALLQGGVLAHHVVDRVADIGEQREGDEAYRQQDENGLQQPSDDEGDHWSPARSEEHTSELQSLMRISYAVFCLKKKTNKLIYRKIKKCNHQNK